MLPYVLTAYGLFRSCNMPFAPDPLWVGASFVIACEALSTHAVVVKASFGSFCKCGRIPICPSAKVTEVAT